ncbi:MAG TPA: CotH kinase family protein, partial [Verrucomicrobiae bacterium]|nr:CotH kinase family protein [Verrucomicrobiae bacterium]
YFNAFESALYGSDFADPKTGYAAYLDVDAFIDAHWLVEMSKNVDGFRYSAFLFKDRNGKINAGPPWDWNRSFGNANYYGGGQTHGWYWSRLRPNEISWYQRLREDPEFARHSAARWKELRKDIFEPKNISALIDQYAGQLHEAQQRNFERWPIIGEQITCNFYVGHSYEDEVRWLKKWITDRINWIDRQMNTPGEPDPQNSSQ